MAKDDSSPTEKDILRQQQERLKQLEGAIGEIKKEYGDGSIIRMGDGYRVDVDVIPTGNLLIDRALGVGGFPRGRIIEVFGPESSGKTTLTLTAIAQAQKKAGLPHLLMLNTHWIHNTPNVSA